MTFASGAGIPDLQRKLRKEAAEVDVAGFVALAGESAERACRENLEKESAAAEVAAEVAESGEVAAESEERVGGKAGDNDIYLALLLFLGWTPRL